MLPDKTIKIGNFTYKIVNSTFSGNTDHGETCTDSKEILINKNQKNLEVIQDTVLHEALHALCEDLFETIEDINGLDKKEEQFIRIFTPRLLRFIKENSQWTKWLCKQTKRS